MNIGNLANSYQPGLVLQRADLWPAFPFQPEHGVSGWEGQQGQSRGSLAPFWKALGGDSLTSTHEPTSPRWSSVTLNSCGAQEGWEGKRLKEQGGARSQALLTCKAPDSRGQRVGDQMGPRSWGCPWTAATLLPNLTLSCA